MQQLQTEVSIRLSISNFSLYSFFVLGTTKVLLMSIIFCHLCDKPFTSTDLFFSEMKRKKKRNEGMQSTCAQPGRKTPSLYSNKVNHLASQLLVSYVPRSRLKIHCDQSIFSFAHWSSLSRISDVQKNHTQTWGSFLQHRTRAEEVWEGEQDRETICS